MDNELQKFELQQCKERLGMIESFLPESFTRRGGESWNWSILIGPWRRKRFYVKIVSISICALVLLQMLQIESYPSPLRN